MANTPREMKYQQPVKVKKEEAPEVKLSVGRQNGSPAHLVKRICQSVDGQKDGSPFFPPSVVVTKIIVNVPQVQCTESAIAKRCRG